MARHPRRPRIKGRACIRAFRGPVQRHSRTARPHSLSLTGAGDRKNARLPPAAGVPETAGDLDLGWLFDKDGRDPGWRQTLATISYAALAIAHRCLRADGLTAFAWRQCIGLTTKFFDALVNRVEIIGGAGSGHIPSLVERHLGLGSSPCLRALGCDSAEPARMRQEGQVSVAEDPVKRRAY